MSSGLGNFLKDSLEFGFSPKRWMPLFMADVLFSVLIFIEVLQNLSTISFYLQNAEFGLPVALMILQRLSLALALGVAWILARIWVEGAVIHQAWKPHDRDYSAPFRFSLVKYPVLFAAQLVVFIASMIAGMIPLVGILGVLLVSWVFFLLLQTIIVDNEGFSGSLSKSYEVFRKYPGKIIVMWLLLVIIESIIVLAFSIPLILVVLSALFSASGGATPFLLLRDNFPEIMATMILFFLGTAIGKAFSLHAKTAFYVQSKKKKFVIL